MNRELRQPPAQEVFDAIEIPVAAPAVALPRIRLANPRYSSQFYANPASRLTPISRKFPCVYLGESKQTAVAEIWGDRFWHHREKSSDVFTIAKEVAGLASFMEAPSLPDLKLCDLTNPDVQMAIGLDAGTLYCPQIDIPKSWAERIARHPARFDGILYRSRVTSEPCLVVWLREKGRALDKEIAFPSLGPFYESPEAYSVAKKCGIRLAFV